MTGYSALMAGLALTLAGAALTTCAAFADSVNVFGSTVTLRDTQAPGAVAEVVLHNRPSNGPADRGRTFPLTHGALTVEAEFFWDHNDAGDDSVTVTVPDGFLCDPPDCLLVCGESAVCTMPIYALDSVGF